MKLIYYINKFFLITTGVLYLTIILGLYAQVVLGGIQLISALLIFIYWNKFTEKTKKMIYIYWSSVLVYGSLWLIDWNFLNDMILFIGGIILLPMSLAVYFFYILDSIKNIKHEHANS